MASRSALRTRARLIFGRKPRGTPRHVHDGPRMRDTTCAADMLLAFLPVVQGWLGTVDVTVDRHKTLTHGWKGVSLRQAVSHYETEPEPRMPARAPGATAPSRRVNLRVFFCLPHTGVDDWWKLWLAAPPASQRS